MCLLVNRRHQTARIIDFRSGASLAKRNAVLTTAKREGIEKLFVLVERDELLRPGLTSGDLERFPAAFAPLGALGAEALVNAVDPALGGLRYLHAVPHCPPMADGAALVLIGTRERAAEFGLTSRARLAAAADYRQAGRLEEVKAHIPWVKRIGVE
jgi:acetyl-CoA acetyltransferase